MHSFCTERLWIRPLIAQDEGIYCQLYSDEKLMKYISKPFEVTEAEALFRVQLRIMTRKRAKQLTWAVCNKKTKEVFGIVGIIFSENRKKIEVGLILNNENSNQGYATEVLTKLITHCSSWYSVFGFHAQLPLDTTKSINLFSRLGFCPESIQKTSHKNILNYILEID